MSGRNVIYFLILITSVFLIIIYNCLSYQFSSMIIPQRTIELIKLNRSDFYENIGVIIEFRSSDLLVSIIENVLSHIPSHWPIQLFHGRENLNFIRNSTLNRYIEHNRIFLTELDSIVVDAMGFTSRLLTNISFWQLVRGEKVLLFQLDSLFCSNSSHKIEDYLSYDYIGAPWHSRFQIPVKVGNGGFSLRSRSKILSLLNILTYNASCKYHEDIWFSQNLHLVNGTIAPEHIAKTFSVETMFYPKPLAIHKPIYLQADQLAELCQNCPDMKLIPQFCK